MKRTYLKRRIPLRRYTALKSCTGIKRVSRHQARINYRWSITVKICKARCGGVCEVRGPECLVTYGITPHHVVPRARGGSHSPANAIMGCCECHNHHKYSGGIPLSIDDALELVRRLNEEHGIEAG
jgi:5-methylcytosine-specific restriction endonuclease McrA